jgi:para-nitrobenzyl esterase
VVGDVSVKKQKEYPNSQSSKNISRRALIRGGAALAAGTGASALVPSTLISAAEAQALSAACVPHAVTMVASASKNIVETDSGRVFGYLQDGVVTFKGIPYGASTAGKNRFMPPVKPAPWAGVRSALDWGPVAPQPSAYLTGGRQDDASFILQREDGHSSEDCLRINVWTPSINDSAKRPVMMWIHGGGFFSGSAQSSPAYQGDNLVRRGGVVVVSINHRLGVLGYANLMNYGEQYASSPNAGMLDIVAALEWVKTNISNFGGDPNKILIFGHSGGGSKITTLMAMPSAKGLFHRAVVESGTGHLRVANTDDAAHMAAAVIGELDLTKSTIGKIHELPVDQIIEAGVHSRRAAAESGMNLGYREATDFLDLEWVPVFDGKVLPRQPWSPDAPFCSANVPLLVGSTLNETYNSVQMGDATLEAMTMAEVRKRLSGRVNNYRNAALGQGADHVIEVLQKAYPGATPFTIFSIISATATRRLTALTMAARKTAQGAAPAFNYWFQWQTPILDGRPRAFHSSELPFVFYNTERCPSVTGGGPDALDLAGRIADAWIHFARNGDPNHSGLPHWPPYDPAKMPTMIFDTKSVMENDPDGEVRTAIVEAIAQITNQLND